MSGKRRKRQIRVSGGRIIQKTEPVVKRAEWNEKQIKIMRHQLLYALILVALILLVLSSLGGGFWGASTTLQHWSGQLFQGICHQNPLRSYKLNGLQMAVNTRCLGIFSGLLMGWLLIPLMGKMKIKKNIPLWILLFAGMLQIIDFSGNVLDLWVNTNHSRFFTGTLLGFAVVFYIGDLFNQPDQT